MINKLILFFLLSFFYSIAISEEYDFWCSGELTVTEKNRFEKSKIKQQIVIKNNRLFIPGMMMFCNKNSFVFECSVKRLDSIWVGRLDIKKKTFWYYSNNVFQNRTQKFVSLCKEKRHR